MIQMLGWNSLNTENPFEKLLLLLLLLLLL